MTTRLTITAFALWLAAAGAACTTYPVEPASPTFTTDVQPILAAHCVRCHGGGDTLTNEANPLHTGTLDCYLDRWEDRVGDCKVPGAGPDGGLPLLAQCKPGAKYCADATYFELYVFREADGENRMPPPPAAPLNDWELNTLKRWVANGAPK